MKWYFRLHLKKIFKCRRNGNLVHKYVQSPETNFADNQWSCKTFGYFCALQVYGTLPFWRRLKTSLTSVCYPRVVQKRIYIYVLPIRSSCLRMHLVLVSLIRVPHFPVHLPKVPPVLMSEVLLAVPFAKRHRAMGVWPRGLRSQHPRVQVITDSHEGKRQTYERSRDGLHVTSRHVAQRDPRCQPVRTMAGICWNVCMSCPSTRSVVHGSKNVHSQILSWEYMREEYSSACYVYSSRA